MAWNTPSRNRKRKEEEERTFNSLARLVGQKVKGVTRGNVCGYILIFENGLQLTAIDGEYGDNAFSFVEED